VGQNLSVQQNLTSFSVAVVVHHAKSNRLADLRPLVPNVLAVIEHASPTAIAFIAT
jgi:hypothetical protein